MKISFSMIILFLLITSCGSSPKSKSKSNDVLPDDLSSLKDDDFKPKKQVRYNDRADYHIIEDLVDDALKDESLAKIETSKLKKLNESISSIVSLCYQGNSETAFNELDKIYKQYYKNPSYWNQIGSCYLMSGKYRKAKIFFNKAFSIDSNYIPAVNNLGVVYIHEGKNKKALAAFKEVVRKKPNSKTSKFNLATLYLKHGLFRKAESMLRTIPNSHKDKDITLAQIYIEIYKGKYQEALNRLKSVGGDHLATPAFSLPLFFVYKKLGRDDASKIERFLSGEKLNKDQRETFSAIKAL